MQTIEHYFNTLPENIRSIALERLTNNDYLVSSHSEAVSFGFRWYETKEGYRYWQSIFEQLKTKRKQLKTKNYAHIIYSRNTNNHCGN